MEHDPESTLPQSEQISDTIDRASDIEQRATAQAIYDTQRRCKPQQLPRDDGTYEVTDCDECGNEIPYGRLRVAIMNRLCVYCAEILERTRGRR